MMETSLKPDLLEGLHVVVTGGGSGLGRAMAFRFVELGARVTINGRRKGPLLDTTEEIRARGGDATGIPCNIREPDEVQRFFAAAERALGPVSALVNNAAANFLARTELLSASAFDAVVRTNLYGTFYCTQTAGRQWIERGDPGRVLSIVTTYAETGSAFVVPSAVSKAGIVAMTRSLAAEWGRHGIRLNAIAPGPFPTPGAWERLVPSAELEKEMRDRVPLARFGRPTELADLAAFMLSDSSAYLTGAVVTLDGGEVLASGGQFNYLTRLEPEILDALLDALRKT